MINPEWSKDFSAGMHQRYVHDLGNLTLTLGNPALSNKEFVGKKGTAGQEGYCYANSSLRVERELTPTECWNEQAILERSQTLIAWAKQRWAVDLGDIVYPFIGEVAQHSGDGDAEVELDEDPIMLLDDANSDE